MNKQTTPHLDIVLLGTVGEANQFGGSTKLLEAGAGRGGCFTAGPGGIGSGRWRLFRFTC